MSFDTLIATTGESLARASRAANGRWAVKFLLEGENVRCLAVDPHNSDIVYAGTQSNGLLRSVDRGRTWQTAGLAGLGIKSMAFSQAEPDVIYAGTKPPYIFVSRDGGENWTELESFRQMRQPSWKTPAEPGDPYVLGLAVSPTEPNIIVAGIEYGAMLRSADGGLTWQGHLKRTSKDCHSLKFHATDGNWVYQGGGGWPAAVSRDGGLSWSQPRRGMGMSFYGWSVAADPERPEIWYVSAAPYVKFPHLRRFPTAHWDGYANASIFRATSGGRWQKLTGGLPQPLDYMAYALLTDPASPGHLCAGLSNGDIWHTTDHGDSWAQIPVNLKGIHQALVAL